ncbi:Dynamin family protein [Flavobacterium micromati]|uniref:Dynamin family protein n=1 Tax=Flavobacterium micromati TaxID=229205 RepID=A0A1M5JW63_9FLAO|nr:dynamin family protein [Flavobacterium micromati]SHG44817.1 Dynamin family protein [Flavobacterium micromati]
MIGQKNYVKIKYNTYTYQVEIVNDLCNKVGSRCNDIVNANNGTFRIGDWFEKFLKIIYEDFNDNFKIHLESTAIDIEVVSEIINDFNNKGKIKFSFESKVIDCGNILETIKLIIDQIKSNKNVLVQETLKKEIFNSIFDKINENDVSIAFLATVSAGKSTLVNSFIGKDLLPAKALPCTATICEITNTNIDFFSGTIYDENYKLIKEQKDITKEFISEYNDKANSEFIKIHIKGKIQNLAVDGINLTIYDTPGPNNSLNEKHWEITNLFIKDSSKKPLIVYLIPAKNIGTKDDKSIIEVIAKEINDKGKIAKERIVFVLNQIDDLNTKENPIDQLLLRCREYLADNDIKNVNIFPLSSKAAQLALKGKSNLDYEEEGDFEGFQRKFFPNPEKEYLGVDTIKNAPISEKIKNKFYEEINKDLDSDRALLHYSGFSALKYYLESYINENHKITLIHNLIVPLKSFLEYVIYNNEIKLQDSDEQIKKQTQELKKLGLFLGENFETKKKQLIDKINELNVDQTVFTKLRTDIFLSFGAILTILTSGKIKKEDAQTKINEAHKIVFNTDISLKTSIDSDCNYYLEKAVKEINALVINSFNDLIKDANLAVSLNNFLINDIKVGMIDTKQFISKESIKTTKYEKVGEQEISTSIWYKPRTWYSTKKVDIYENVDYVVTIDYVDGQKMYDNHFSNLQAKAFNSVEDSKKKFEEEIKKIKENGTKLVHKIEMRLKEKSNEHSKLSFNNRKTEEEKLKIVDEMKILKSINDQLLKTTL